MGDGARLGIWRLDNKKLDRDIPFFLNADSGRFKDAIDIKNVSQGSEYKT